MEDLRDKGKGEIKPDESRAPHARVLIGCSSSGDDFAIFISE